ncbi:MAG: threonine--tRNA ligase [Erysipelotrichaceae bacterium]|nr:threonine--tRNA ligase [Erysipelotrichaceae bacterium]
MINIKENLELNTLNHSCAHLMAQAIKHLYPHAKFWVGPVIEEGFYYDIDLGNDVIKEEDFPKIEKEMKKLSKDGKRITRIEISKQEALEMFKDDEYKLDLIENLPEDAVITAYRQGDYTDLCRGPHVESCKEIKFFKLLKASGAYYKGDASKKMLQRVYGICFYSQEDLDQHLALLEEAKKRDHKKLGRELDLFMMSEYAPGMPFFLPKGMILRNVLENYWYEEHTKEGYLFVKTPVMMSKELWETSGHWQNYKENMYVSLVDDKEFAIKPMNCPGGMLVFKNSLHSYKDLPLRVGELGLVHRHEASGALNGLFRVRTFTQDDAHIFMTIDQIESEVVRLIAFIDRVYSALGLPYDIELSTRPEEKFIGDIEVWNRSEQALADACKAAGKDYKINPGDGAFYGPKLDFHVKDSLGRVWQCGTIQLDMNLPERFDLTYVDNHGNKVRPVMLHRVIFGSIERFIGILIEHFAGAFPTWLSPVQVNILPVAEVHNEYARSVKKELEALGIRCELDDSSEKLGYRLRLSQIKKTPYTLVIGDKEVENKSVTYRIFSHQEQINVSKEEFINLILDEIKNKLLRK